MTKNLSDPLFERRGIATVHYSELLNKESMLGDVSYIAQPGLYQRVAYGGRTVERGSDLSSLRLMSKQRNMSKEKPSLQALFEDVSVVRVQGGFTNSLLWCTLVAVCPAMQYGVNNANMNTPEHAIRESLGLAGGALTNDSTNATTTAADGSSAQVWGLCVSVFCLGALLGCYLAGSQMDKTGRRATIKMLSVAFALGCLLEAASGVVGNYYVMILGRAFSGFASGGTTVAVPLYLGELAPAHLRGALGTCFQLSVVVAMLVAQVLGLPALMGTEKLWTYYMLLTLFPAIFVLFFKNRLVKSPVWLASRGDADHEGQAREALVALRGLDSSIDQELSLMKQNVGNNKNGTTASDVRLCENPKVKKGLLICIVCSMVQQLSGINNVFNYSTKFLQDNGLDVGTVTIISVAMNVGNVVVSIGSLYLMDKLGRKSLLLISSCGMFVCTLLLTASLSGNLGTYTNSGAILSVVGFVTSFGVGLGPIPWLFPAELLPNKFCAKGSAVAASLNWSANFVIAQTFPPLSAQLQAFCFMPNAVILFLFIIFVCVVVPETRGKTHDEIMSEI